jgi:hypothetical protein
VTKAVECSFWDEEREVGGASVFMLVMYLSSVFFMYLCVLILCTKECSFWDEAREAGGV